MCRCVKCTVVSDNFPDLESIALEVMLPTKILIQVVEKLPIFEMVYDTTPEKYALALTDFAYSSPRDPDLFRDFLFKNINLHAYGFDEIRKWDVRNFTNTQIKYVLDRVYEERELFFSGK